MNPIMWITTMLMWGFLLTPSYAEDRYTLPQTEWVKLLAWVDHAKQLQKNQDTQITICMKASGAKDQLITIYKKQIDQYKLLDTNHEVIQTALNEEIGRQERALYEAQQNLEKEKRLSRYKSEAFVGVVLAALAVAFW